MAVEQYSPEQLKEMSMLEVAYLVFKSKKQAITFNQLLDEVVGILGLSKAQVNSKVAQFYTDINIDGRFICIGEAGWGLRSWYPYEQIDEEVTTPIKPKKKKAKKAAEDDDLDVLDYDEEELDYDDLDEYEEEDLDEDLDEEDDDDADEVDADFDEDDSFDDEEDELVEEEDEFELEDDLDEEELDEEEDEEL
ncbi:DNA-directed RNA polymerase subunit delta [Litchfieldia alkalitelluris]|uniref:DNA-directed RNA polymerase subunit delta n=1 Tax=Litchfieldia alkalitelluris TaxID=304268 RepID=UPI0009978B04|nr:DNA-directed RNA polymerase subunit delta [Litchfieldia alkalitelluris]